MAGVSLEILEARTFLAFGQLDASFGAGGHAFSSFAGSVRDVQVVGGKILAGGTGGLGRYLSDGKPDTSFGAGGETAISNLDFRGMAVDTGGRVYVLGVASGRTVLWRYTSVGQLESAYGTSGTALVTTSTKFTPQAIVVQLDDKVLVAGVVKDSASGNIRAKVFRFNSDGTPDIGFGSSAAVNIQLGKSNLLTPNVQDNVAGLAALSDGKIVIAGGSRSYSPGGYDSTSGTTQPFTYGDTMFAVARLNNDGSQDSTYGAGGFARSIYVSGEKSNFVTTATVASDGAAALATSTIDPAIPRLIVAEFAADGSLLFNRTAGPGYELGTPLDLAAKSDGRVFILGNNSVRDHGLSLAWISPGGVFSNVVRTQDPSASAGDIAGGTVGVVAVADDGDLVVAGKANRPPAGYALAEFSSGALGDPRRDQFANARVSDIYRDKLGGLHIAWFDTAASVLKYAYRGSSGLWDDPVTVDATPNAGLYLSVATDSKGRPGIAYFDGTSGDLRFARKSGSTWVTEKVDGRGSVGLYPSMLFDDLARPNIVYYDKTRGNLKFAVRNMKTGIWGFEIVQSAGDVGRSPTLAIDPKTNRLEVAYVDSTNKQVNWAQHRKKATWGVMGAAVAAGGAGSLSLSYSRTTKQPAIAFYDAATADLKLSTFSGTKWATRTLIKKGKIGLYNHLRHDDKGALIYTYDKTNDRVLLVRDLPSGVSIDPIVTGGGKYLSVFSNGVIADMAFFDSATGVIEVRGAPA